MILPFINPLLSLSLVCSYFVFSDFYQVENSDYGHDGPCFMAITLAIKIVFFVVWLNLIINVDVDFVNFMTLIRVY